MLFWRRRMSVLQYSFNPPSLLLLLPPFSTCITSFPRSRTPSSPSSPSWLLVVASRRAPAVIRSLNSGRESGRHIESEWSSSDLSAVVEALRGWGLPLALGAMIGSFLSSKFFVFTLSFSFLASVAVVKVLEVRGEPFASLIQGWQLRLPIIFSKIVQSRVSTIALNVTLLFCNVASEIARCSRDFLDFLGACGRSVLLAKQNNGIRLTSSDSVFPYLQACFARMENLIQKEETNAQKTDPICLDEFRETLDLLRESVETMLLTMRKQSFEKSLTFRVKNNKSIGKGNSASLIEVDGKHECSEICVLRGLSQKPDSMLAVPESPTEHDNHGDVQRTITLSEVALYSIHTSSFNRDNKCDGNDGFQHVQLRQNVLIPETCKSNDNSIQSRYPDYWLHVDAEQSTTMFDVVASKQNNHGTISTEKEDLYANRQNFWLDKPQNREKDVDTEDDSQLVDNIEALEPIGRRWCSEGQLDDLHLSSPAADDNERKDSLSKQQKNENREQISLKENVEANVFQPSQSKKNATDGNPFNVHAVNLMEELPFIRDTATMPAITEGNFSEYQKLMNEGEILFHDGKTGLDGKIEVGQAETFLYRAADIFSSAAAIDPSSIEATGFWGNTHLVHGKLQHRLSRELRLIISSLDTISPYQVRRQMMTTQEARKWVTLEEKLQVIGKECEEHFIQAGRKYRQVLSIHNRNVPALYNWGLALFLRAQMVAAEQDAAQAADRIYMAAIDKFEAMMGISQKYVPKAALNWGLTLRARSRLRPMNNPERIDLLSQAKQLLEDAVRLQHHDINLYGIIAACNIELEELERKEMMSKKASKFIVGD